MRKLKITSFDQEGVRSGRSLEGVLSEIGNEESSLEHDNNGEEHVLQICRLSFTTNEKASAMGRLILSRTWSKIVLEKTSGRFVSLVVQDAVSATRIFQVKQHQRYDGIKWNFGIDWFPQPNNSPLREIHFTGVRFRGGDELKFLKSLGEGLSQSSTSLTGNSMGLKNLELNACRFLHPEVQYPILFQGLKVACFGTLQRLWMPKSPGLDDDRFQELFGEILGSSDDPSCISSVVELGFSYNSCGWKGSKAVCSFLQSPRSANLQVLYLNRQHGELDLEGILQSASTRTGKLQMNLSQNYVSSLETLEQLRTISGTNDSSDKQTPSNTLSLDVQLDSMSFEVPETVIPGNGSNQNRTNGSNNELNKGTKTGNRQKSYEEHLQNLTQEDIAKLNVACGRVKYVLGRAAAACDRSKDPMLSSTSNPVNENNDSNGSDWFFSSLAALDCVLPDLLTIIRLQEKQNGQDSKENQNNNTQQQTRQYRNWLPTFLRKAIKGKIEVLKPWLLSASKGQNDSTAIHTDDAHVTVEGARPPIVLTEAERERLTALWQEIEALHTNIAHHAGQRRHKHSTGQNPGEIPVTLKKEKQSRNKNHNRKGLAEIPMTPDANPLVKEAYEGIPLIPTRLLESSNDNVLSLPMQSNHEAQLESSETNQIRTAPPIFIDTADGLELLRDDLFQKPPPYKIPKMVAVDSEWYFIDENEQDTQQGHSRGGSKKRVKHRSMSVATLQIAYVDENESPVVLRSFVIDLLSNQPGFQKLAKECVFWLFASPSCDTMVLGFACGGDLRQLRKYAGITNQSQDGSTSVASLEVVASRCLDIQHLLSSPDEIRKGRAPGLKKCAELFFAKSLKKDDQTSDWKERPLRPSQLEYAALDAVILLVLLSQKKQADEKSALSSAAI